MRFRRCILVLPVVILLAGAPISAEEGVSPETETKTNETPVTSTAKPKKSVSKKAPAAKKPPLVVPQITPSPKPDVPPVTSRTFSVTAGMEEFVYLHLKDGKEVPPKISVVYREPDALGKPENALWRMLQHGPCPGTFLMGKDNTGSFTFHCRNGLRGTGQLSFDPLSRKYSGKGILREKVKLEFKE